MDVQAELANAIKQRYTKVYGIDCSSKTEGEHNDKISRRQKPAISESRKLCRSETNKAAAASLIAKMGGRQEPLSFATETEKSKKWGSKIQFSSPKDLSLSGNMVSGIESLTKIEEENAQRYRNMIKMGLPEGAVRHKMISNGFSERVAEAVISGDDSSHSKTPISQKLPVDSSSRKSLLSIEEENLATKYRKMAKVGMPEGAVLHKMIADGVPGKIQNAVMTAESPSASQKRSTAISSTIRSARVNEFDSDFMAISKSSRRSLSPEEEKIASQYRTMIKIKMPEGAVRHKMSADGVPEKIQESVLCGGPTQISLSPIPSLSSSCRDRVGNVSTLSREDETSATLYRKMMKMGMPEGAVKHKMTADGIAWSIQSSVLREEIPAVDSLGEKGTDVASSKCTAANPMTAAITSSGGVGSLKKAPLNEKRPVGVCDKITAPSMRLSANPMAAAILSSGGIGSLKKTSTKEKEVTASAISSNPLAASIIASRGRSGLRTTSFKQPPKSVSCDTLVGDLSSKGSRSTLKKTPKKSLSTGNALPCEFASIGSRSSLRKSPQKLLDRSHDKNNGDKLNVKYSYKVPDLQEEIPESADEKRSPRHVSEMKVKSVRKSEEPSEMCSNRTTKDNPSRGLSSTKRKSASKQEGPSETSNKKGNRKASQSHLSSIKMKSRRSQKESPEMNINTSDKNYSERNVSSAKKDSATKPKELCEWGIDETSMGDSPRHLSGIKINSVRPIEKMHERETLATEKNDSQRYLSHIDKKALRSTEVLQQASKGFGITNEKKSQMSISGKNVKSFGSSEGSSERSSCELNQDNSLRHLSGIKIKSDRSSKELSGKSAYQLNENTFPRHLSGIKIKSIRLPDTKIENSANIDLRCENLMINPLALKQIQDKHSIHSRGTSSPEINTENLVDQSSRNQSIKIDSTSLRSGTRTKEPNSRVKHIDQRRNSHSITTDDGVDHHCQCSVM